MIAMSTASGVGRAALGGALVGAAATAPLGAPAALPPLGAAAADGPEAGAPPVGFAGVAPPGAHAASRLRPAASAAAREVQRRGMAAPLLRDPGSGRDGRLH